MSPLQDFESWSKSKHNVKRQGVNLLQIDEQNKRRFFFVVYIVVSSACIKSWLNFKSWKKLFQLTELKKWGLHAGQRTPNAMSLRSLVPYPTFCLQSGGIKSENASKKKQKSTCKLHHSNVAAKIDRFTRQGVARLRGDEIVQTGAPNLRSLLSFSLWSIMVDEK